MKISKIANGYTVEYSVENKDSKSEWDSAYIYYTYAFPDWSSLTAWIVDKEGLVK